MGIKLIVVVIWFLFKKIWTIKCEVNWFVKGSLREISETKQEREKIQTTVLQPFDMLLVTTIWIKTLPS